MRLNSNCIYIRQQPGKCKVKNWGMRVSVILYRINTIVLYIANPAKSFHSLSYCFWSGKMFIFTHMAALYQDIGDPFTILYINPIFNFHAIDLFMAFMSNDILSEFPCMYICYAVSNPQLTFITSLTPDPLNPWLTHAVDLLLVR